MAIMKQLVVTVAVSRMSKQQREKKKMTKILFRRPTISLGMLYNEGTVTAAHRMSVVVSKCALPGS